MRAELNTLATNPQTLFTALALGSVYSLVALGMGVLTTHRVIFLRHGAVHDQVADSLKARRGETILKVLQEFVKAMHRKQRAALMIAA